VYGVRRREACLPLRQGTDVRVCVLDVSVSICVRGRVRLGNHDPGEGGEGRVDRDRRMGAAVAAMTVVVRIEHVDEVGRTGRKEA